MNIVNPPVFDHIIDNSGDSVKLFRVDIGTVSFGIGDSIKTVAMPGGIPSLSSVLGFDFIRNPAFGGAYTVNGFTLWDVSVMATFHGGLDYGTNNFTFIYTNTTNTGAKSAIDLLNVIALIWYK